MIAIKFRRNLSLYFNFSIFFYPMNDTSKINIWMEHSTWLFWCWIFSKLLFELYVNPISTETIKSTYYFVLFIGKSVYLLNGLLKIYLNCLVLPVNSTIINCIWYTVCAITEMNAQIVWKKNTFENKQTKYHANEKHAWKMKTTLATSMAYAIPNCVCACDLVGISHMISCST